MDRDLAGVVFRCGASAHARTIFGYRERLETAGGQTVPSIRETKRQTGALARQTFCRRRSVLAIVYNSQPLGTFISTGIFPALRERQGANQPKLTTGDRDRSDVCGFTCNGAREVETKFRYRDCQIHDPGKSCLLARNI